jgi:ribosome biogenesis GTPase
MARWQNKSADQLEKIGKMRRRSKRTQSTVDLEERFELDDSDWPRPEEGEAFAARVVEVHKRYAFVSTEKEVGKIDTRDVWLATIARKFLQANRQQRNFVVVGDRVLCTPAPGGDAEQATDLPKCVIQNMAPRRSQLTRLDPHTPGRQHVLASNMDQLLIVASLLKPKVKWGLIDRYLVLAESEGLEAIIVLNKKDLLADEKPAFIQQVSTMVEIYRGLGYTVLQMQANSKKVMKSVEVHELKEKLAGKITLLSGHSGVGKSSVVNLFKPEIEQAVEPDEDIFYKGRHTTSYASFIKLSGLKPHGFVIDTPGIRSFTFEEKTAIELSHCFVEMRPLLGRCKYRECHHVDEPGCLVIQGVENGAISKWRYKSYLSILMGASGREGRTRDIEAEEGELEADFEADE